MKYLFLTLLGIFSAIHLYHSWQDKGIHRAKTKPFLLLFLILYYVFATDKVELFLMLALIASWLGDVLLIPAGNKWFVMGGISFMISHFFFILTYYPNIDFSKVIWPIALPMAVVYFGISILIIRAVKAKTPKSMLFPMCFYLFCNSTMNLFALMQLMTHMNKGAVFAIIGAALFFVSDCCLFLVRYGKRPTVIFKKHFTVMLTYILGEFLIVLGMMYINA